MEVEGISKSMLETVTSTFINLNNVELRSTS